MVKLARLVRCAVRTALVPSLRSLSASYHNPQHRMSRFPVRHALDMPILCPRVLLLTMEQFIQITAPALILDICPLGFPYYWGSCPQLHEVLQHALTPFVTVP